MRRFLPLVVCLATLSLAHAAAPLSGSSSPFLRAQADSAVNWLPWGEEAFARARTEQKPIFLSVGLLTSELSRAMMQQTFANAETAAFLNEHFVCVLVDADERPQLTALYQNYIQATKQLRGLPLNLWLTPDLKPFDGANYLPPTEEWGKEGFLTVARRAAAGWEADPAAQRHKADEAVAAVLAAQTASAPPPRSADDLTRSLVAGTEAWQARYDTAHAGFGEPPKYLEPELLRFLLGKADTQEMAVSTLRAMLHAAVRDPLDGGFFRYVNDPEWRLPYFQKTLVDQARIALALLDAAKISDNPAFAEAARGALHFVLASLALDGGGFAAVLDATPEPLIAAQLWTKGEITALLGEKVGEAFCRAHGVTAEGNLAPDAFPGVETAGKNILFHADPTAAASLADARAKLLQVRRDRAIPLHGGKAASSAHGLLLAAFARAGAELNDARLAAAAQTEFAFVRDRLLTKDGHLRHLSDEPSIATPADHAMMIEGLLAFHAAADQAEARTLAERLLADLDNRFLDKTTGRYFVTVENADTGIWARVHALPPTLGEPASAEAALLTALSRHSVSGGEVELLARAVAADIDESAEAPRGDLLLALEAYRNRTP